MQMQKEIHLTGRDLVEMVQLRPQDVGMYAIIPGPRDRMEAVVKRLSHPVKNFSFFEYTMYTGDFQGIKVSTINGGRFSTDTAITTEVVCCAGIKNIMRIGTCGALDENIKVGELIVVDSVIRGDGVTNYYVDKTERVLPDKEITATLFKVAGDLELRVHQGCVWTTDALLRETRGLVEQKRKEGAVAVDMVSSSILTIAQHYKVKAGAILAVSDNVITGELGFMNPLYYMAEAKLIDVVFKTIGMVLKPI